MAVRILHLKSHSSLPEFSADVFRLLGIKTYEEHESENYPDGVYFVGESGDLIIKVSLEDDFGFEDYQYWVTAQMPSQSDIDIEEQVDQIATRLLKAGYGVSRSVEEHEDHILRSVYLFDPAAGLRKTTEKRTIPAQQ